jgi:hypothetical protein
MDSNQRWKAAQVIKNVFAELSDDLSEEKQWEYTRETMEFFEGKGQVIDDAWLDKFVTDSKRIKQEGRWKNHQVNQ